MVKAYSVPEEKLKDLDTAQLDTIESILKDRVGTPNGTSTASRK